jgi:uncharacterized membrane protein SpoIIM required for sporulation
MSIAEFEQRRQEDWSRLAELLDRVGASRLRGLEHSELVEIRVLYRRVAGDLATVQSMVGGERLEDYLNDLVARGHALLYAAPKRSFRAGLVELLYAGPEALRRRIGYVLLSVAIFIAGAGAGALLTASDPTWTSTLMPPDFNEALEHWKTGQFDKTDPVTRFAFGALLHVNNTMVSLIVFGTGILWGVLPVWILLNNGMLIGVFSVELAKAGQLYHFIGGIAAHGVPELSAIFFSAGGGFLLAHAMIAPGELSRVDALREKGRDAFWMLAVSLVLLLEAAVVEAYLSHSQLAAPLKLTVAALSVLALLAFIYGVRRPSQRAPMGRTRA